MFPSWVLLIFLESFMSFSQTRNPNVAGPAEFEALQSHFERCVRSRNERLFQGISTVGQWERRKQEVRAQLKKMLWHDRRWPDQPPAAVITHRQTQDRYVIENLVLETAPKLFVTANLYLPRTGPKPFPVVLYQCGHANKAYYKRHGAWFASHGVAALVMDNIEMGEAQFTHHGVFAQAWFHWYSRGFSPLAIELWNARRLLDYLVSRPEIDRLRIGATGRSGGGMTSFFLAALDDRIAACAPVSGTLSTQGWIKQRLTAVHCDCQYPVNSYGLLYSEIGALIAPRPLLVCNADSDPGFPMEAFQELVANMRVIYRLYEADNNLSTAVTSGGHQDTEAIRLPVYSFFLKHFLGQEIALVEEGPVQDPPSEALLCYRSGLPLEEVLSGIDERWITLRKTGTRPLSLDRRQVRRQALLSDLRREVFGYFPKQPPALDAQWGPQSAAPGRKLRPVSFTSFDGLRVKAIYSLPAAPQRTKLPAVLVADYRRGIPVWGNEEPWERKQWGDRAVLVVETLDVGSRALERNLRSFTDNDAAHHMRRQAMILGTTIESMQVYELLRSLEFLRTLSEVDGERITLSSKGEMAVNAMYAALMDGKVERVILHSPTGSHRQGPHYLNVLRYTDVSEVASLVNGVRVMGEAPAELAFVPQCRDLPACLP